MNNEEKCSADGIGILIDSIEATGSKSNKDNICVHVVITNGKNRELRKIVLIPEVFVGLGLCRGSISREDFRRLDRAGQLCEVIIRGINILAYGDNTAKELEIKLMRRGADRNTASVAVRFLKAHGYLNEENAVLRDAEIYVGKLWGERRIIAKLKQDGYGEGALSRVREMLSETDFTENCVQLIRNRYMPIPAERNELAKIFAALQRYGYTTCEIKDAIRTAGMESDE